jgi:hypothetical protein
VARCDIEHGLRGGVAQSAGETFEFPRVFGRFSVFFRLTGTVEAHFLRGTVADAALLPANDVTGPEYRSPKMS